MNPQQTLDCIVLHGAIETGDVVPSPLLIESKSTLSWIGK
jgi:hypothetical protein